MVSYLIDIVLAVMLVTTTVFLVVVNKRLQVLRSGQSEINSLITTFSQTIDETDASVRRLVAAATEISAKLADELDRAKVVKEDTTLLLGSCDRATKRMEESIQHARSLVRRLEEGAHTRRPAQQAAPAREPYPANAAGMPEPETPLNAVEVVAAPPADEAPAAVDADAPSANTSGDGAFRPLPLGAAKPSVEHGRQIAAGAFYARLRSIAGA
ncbi:MAG TPA: DUF6468 domain-containing protein [Azospirillum sp.]|nr:DUF6468 domain-containing protein [Azospirillum sp.]